MKNESVDFIFHGTQSMRIAMQDLKLDALYVVYSGLHRYPMGEGVEAVPLWAVLPAVGG